MKKKLLFITFLMLFCSTMFGQTIERKYTPANTEQYQDGFTLTTKVSFDGGAVVQQAGLELGVFCGDECRASGMSFDNGLIMVGVLGQDGEFFTFKLYDHNTGIEWIDNTIFYNGNPYPALPFIVDYEYGDLTNPCKIDFKASDNNFYTFDENQYEYDMQVTAIVQIDGVEQTSSELEIGAFCGQNIRGSQKTMYVEGGRYYARMSVYGSNGDNITFKLYDHATKAELVFNDVNTLVFKKDETIGSLADPFEVNFITAPYVAQIGEDKYFTLAAALAAAQDGQTVKLLTDATGAGVVIDKNITIDFDGKTYTFNEGVGNIPSNGFQILQGNDVTLIGGTLNVAEANKNEFYILVQNYANLTVEDMVLDGTNLDKWSAVVDNWDSYTLSNNSGNVNIKGTTTIKANDEGANAFAFDACKYLSYEAPVVTLASTVTVDGKVELSGGELYTTKVGLNIVATKEFAANQTVWGTISTPIQNADIPTIDDFTHDLYAYDEVEQEWEHYKNSDDNPFPSMTLGKGYLYANAGDEKTSVSLEGALNISNVTVALSYTDGNALAGFNMIGNPFSYNISSSNFNTTATLSEGFYVIGANGEWLARPEGTIISPMESVLVKTDVKTALEIVKSGQKRGNMNEEHSYIAVNVSNANYEDLAYVSFGDGKGLDKINHRNSEVPMVYVPVDGKDYAIAVMEEDVVEIPVSFKAATMGEYTIGVEATGCEYAAITLVDRLTGNETNMLLEEYTFVASNKDNVDRFLIKLSMNSDNDDTENFAYINNGMMNINNVEGQGLVKIFDVTGRYVAEYNVFESATISTSEFAAGIYVVQMTDEKGVKVQKIIID